MYLLEENYDDFEDDGYWGWDWEDSDSDAENENGDTETETSPDEENNSYSTEDFNDPQEGDENDIYVPDDVEEEETIVEDGNSYEVDKED